MPRARSAAVLEMFDYVFPENGLQAFKHGQQIGSTVSRRGRPRATLPARSAHARCSPPLTRPLSRIASRSPRRLHTLQSMREFLGEARLKEFINFVLAYLATLDIPIKRGTFIEFRTGMLNVSPIGASAGGRCPCGR